MYHGRLLTVKVGLSMDEVELDAAASDDDEAAASSMSSSARTCPSRSADEYRAVATAPLTRMMQNCSEERRERYSRCSGTGRSGKTRSLANVLD